MRAEHEIPAEILAEPELALCDPRFQTPEGLEQILQSAGDWGYCNNPLYSRIAKVAQTLSQQIADERLKAGALKLIGTSYRQKRAAREALLAFKEAQAIYRKLRDVEIEVGDLYRRKSAVYRLIEDWDRAHESTFISYNILRKVSPHEAGLTLSTQGMNQQEQHLYESALHSFSEARSLIDASISPQAADSVTHNLLACLVVLDYPEEVLQEVWFYLRRSRQSGSTNQSSKKKRSKTQTFRVYISKDPLPNASDALTAWLMALIALRTGYSENAERTLERVVVELERFEDYDHLPLVLLDLLGVQVLRSKLQEARRIAAILPSYLPEHQKQIARDLLPPHKITSSGINSLYQSIEPRWSSCNALKAART